MINAIFNDIDWELTPKRLEQFDKYNQIIQWGRQHPTRFIEDFMKIQLTDHQKWIILSSWVPSTVVWLCSRATGKALTLDTPVYYKISDRGDRYNKKTIGDLEVGDKIYDHNGELTEVIHLNPIIFDTVYEIEFEDGEKIQCNADHLWQVCDRSKSHPGMNKDDIAVRSTDYLYYHYADYFKNNGEKDYRFKVPMNKPLNYPKYSHLPIDPYLLGAWLGDGTSIRGEITCSGDDLDDMVKILNELPGTKTLTSGLQYGKNNCYGIYVNKQKDLIDIYQGNKLNAAKGSFLTKLKNLDLINNKHIPERYMYGTIEERQELLCGLMDTDGYVDKNGVCSFTQANYLLCLQVQELLMSLGIKSTINHKTSNYVKADGALAESWTIFFSASKNSPCFKLKRKFDRLKDEIPHKSGYKAIVKITKLADKKPMRCITVSNQDGLFLCGNHYTVTHNSFMASIFLMARALLLPNTNAYIMGPSGNQAQETFTKLENIASNNIASLMGTSSVFIDECKRMNAKASPFTHDKQSYNVTLYNGSTINTLNSVAKNIVGIRSNFSVFDEAGKIDRDFYALTLPFSVQNTDFVTGSGINMDLYPKQLQNKNLFLSSAEGIDSYLFDMYKLAFNKMLVGDPNYFVADLDCSFSLHPFMNGKPAHPLLQQQTVDDAMATNPYRAQREYYNRFDRDGGEDVFIKRSTITKYSETFYPVYENDGTKKYIVSYDPSSKLDNSIISIFEMFRDEEKGLMLRLVNCENLIELLPSGEKAVIQKPEQIERLKQIMLDYNKRALDYDNLEMIFIDAGAGG